MTVQIVDSCLVLVLLLNFLTLASTRLKTVIYAVAFQGALLGIIYPVAHQAMLSHVEQHGVGGEALNLFRVLLLTGAFVLMKGFVIPRLLLRATREAHIRWQVESAIGVLPTLLIGAVGTGLALKFSETLPLLKLHTSLLVVPASLATVLTGFLFLTTRRKFVTLVVGYLILENGIFIFGLLLVEALPVLVEVGVLLDLFVAVFVMGIIIYHVSQEFPSASTEHLTALRE